MSSNPHNPCAMEIANMMPIVNVVMMMMITDKAMSPQMVATIMMMVLPQLLPPLIEWIKTALARSNGMYSVTLESSTTSDVFSAVSRLVTTLVKDPEEALVMSSALSKRIEAAPAFENPYDWCGNSQYTKLPITCPIGKFQFTYSGAVIHGEVTRNREKNHVQTTMKLTTRMDMSDKLDSFVEFATVSEWKERWCMDTDEKQTVAILNIKNSDVSWKPMQLSTVKTFDNLWLPAGLQTDIINDLDTFTRSHSFYEERGMPHKRGMLFYGPPGTGKTSCIFAIANYLRCMVYRVSLRQCTQSQMKDALYKIKHAAVVVIEEVDLQIAADDMPLFAPLTTPSEVKSGPSGDNAGDNASDKASDKDKVSFLMEYLDGYVGHTPGTLVIFTTNHIDDIPAPLIRPGRIDRQFYFPPLDGEDVGRVARNFTGIPELTCPEGVTISAAELINTVLMPHIGDREALQQQLNTLK